MLQDLKFWQDKKHIIALAIRFTKKLVSNQFLLELQWNPALRSPCYYGHFLSTRKAHTFLIRKPAAAPLIRPKTTF